MSDDRAIRIGVAFARQAASAPPGQLCTACVEVLSVSGAGVTIMSGTNTGPVCSSDERMEQLEDLQFALGEGPCHDAFISGELVSVPDLAAPSPDRWPQYTAAALELGARGVFAVPVSAGHHRIGVLTLYQDVAGPLLPDQIADSLVVARVLGETMISIQSRSRHQVLSGELSDANAHRAEVHQASGMAAIQLHVGVPEALARIRAHAFATDQSVGAVARSIVSHTLLLNDDRIQEEPE